MDGANGAVEDTEAAGDGGDLDGGPLRGDVSSPVLSASRATALSETCGAEGAATSVDGGNCYSSERDEGEQRVGQGEAADGRASKEAAAASDGDGAGVVDARVAGALDGAGAAGARVATASGAGDTVADDGGDGGVVVGMLSSSRDIGECVSPWLILWMVGTPYC